MHTKNKNTEYRNAQRGVVFYIPSYHLGHKLLNFKDQYLSLLKQHWSCELLVVD